MFDNPDPVIQERLAAIKKRLGDIGPLPAEAWTALYPADGNTVEIFQGNTRIASVYNREDADFIMNAPVDQVWLLWELEKAYDEILRLRYQLQPRVQRLK